MLVKIKLCYTCDMVASFAQSGRKHSRKFLVGTRLHPTFDMAGSTIQKT